MATGATGGDGGRDGPKTGDCESVGTGSETRDGVEEGLGVTAPGVKAPAENRLETKGGPLKEHGGNLEICESICFTDWAIKLTRLSATGVGIDGVMPGGDFFLGAITGISGC